MSDELSSPNKADEVAVVAKYDIIKPGGSLTLTSGTGAIKPGTTASIGGALNAGLFTMTQGLANELRPKKIRVNCMVPAQMRCQPAKRDRCGAWAGTD